MVTGCACVKICYSITANFFAILFIKKMTDRATSWSVTINNPVSADEENIALARQKGWKVEGQLEKGKEGTPHYQLLVKTPQVRFSAVKKQFPRAHIEVARNVVALQNYVHKEETREGELMTEQDKYPSMSKLWDLMYAYFVSCNYINCDWDGDWFRKATGNQKPLQLFDEAINHLIREGYFVEGMGVNPQVRGCFDRYWSSILYRCEARRQSDRQTLENNVAGRGITIEDGVEERSDEVEDEDNGRSRQVQTF